MARDRNILCLAGNGISGTDRLGHRNPKPPTLFKGKRLPRPWISSKWIWVGALARGERILRFRMLPNYHVDACVGSQMTGKNQSLADVAARPIVSTQFVMVCRFSNPLACLARRAQCLAQGAKREGRERNSIEGNEYRTAP